MGYLTNELSDAVGPLTKQRGRSYFLSGAVRLTEADGSHVSATVQGSQKYEVEIFVAKTFLDASCTCPFYERDFETCKHIWATALAAEQRSYLKDSVNFNRAERLETVPDSVSQRTGQRAATIKKPAPPTWQQQLQPVLSAMKGEENRWRYASRPERELVYLIDLHDTLAYKRLTIRIAQHDRKMNGAWGKLKTRKLGTYEINNLPDPADRRILAILAGAGQGMVYGYGYSSYRNSMSPDIIIPPALWDVVLPLMCATGRCFLQASRIGDQNLPLQWDDGNPWELCLKLTHENDGETYVVNGALRRGESEIELAKPDLLLEGGLVFCDGQVAHLEDYGSFGWISFLRAKGSLSIVKEEADEFLAELLQFSRQPILELPEELRFQAVGLRPTAHLMIKPAERHPWTRPHLLGKLSFEYEGEAIRADSPGGGIYQKNRRRLIRRDLDFEIAAEKRLLQLGFQSGYSTENSDVAFLPEELPKAVRTLTNEGWHVEAEGKLYRTAGALSMEINSGVDWFELEGGAQFGETRVVLPRLLHAIKQGEQTVRLDDGTLGIIPEEWMKKYDLLAGLATSEGQHLRFTRPQAGLLDALLASEAAVRTDAVFEQVRQQLRNFVGIRSADAPPEFTGRLRGYQCEGLGWLYFLQRFGFGGCLADDMGLGKTIQVLALLESRRELRSRGQNDSLRPSLVVVPRSLVFHWKKEALQFAPQLRILDHTGAGRLKAGEHFAAYDMVAYDLRHSAARRATFQRSALRLLHSRRSPSHQKCRYSLCQGRSSAQG
jgi:hypothetical protein